MDTRHRLRREERFSLRLGEGVHVSWLLIGERGEWTWTEERGRATVLPLLEASVCREICARTPEREERYFLEETR